MLRCKGNSTQCGEIAQGGICLPTKESHLGGFLANAVNGIHGEHISDVISLQLNGQRANGESGT